MQATAAEYAVISCGAGNPYGHPCPDTVEAYQEVGAVVCRTDLVGDVTVVTDGVSVSFGCSVP